MLASLTWITAVIGASLALAASVARARGRLGPAGANRMHLGAYGFLGISVVIFAARGFLS